MRTLVVSSRQFINSLAYLEMKKTWMGFLFAFVLPIVVVLAWWGIFRHATISETTSAPIHFAWIEFNGDLADLPDAQDKLRRILLADHIAPGNPVVILLSDPRHTAKNRQHAEAGFEIPPQTKLPSSIRVSDIPTRKVLRSEVRASILLAPSIAYQGLFNYLKSSGRPFKLPTVEVYTPGNSINEMGILTVDMAD